MKGNVKAIIAGCVLILTAMIVPCYALTNTTTQGTTQDMQSVKSTTSHHHKLPKNHTQLQKQNTTPQNTQVPNSSY